MIIDECEFIHNKTFRLEVKSLMWNDGANCFGGGLPMMMGGGLMMLLFWGLIIFLIVYVVRKTVPNKSSNEPYDAVEVLKKRYSMGEIGTEEYRERLQELLKK